MPTPDSSRPDAPLRSPAPEPLWSTIARALPPRDPASEWYSIKDLAPLVGLKPRALQLHARRLFPDHEGQFRLDHEQAVRLIRRVCASGRKVPKSGDAS